VGERLRADMEYELNHGLHAHAENLSWETFRERFWDEHVLGLRESTWLGYKTALNVFEQEMRPTQVQKITTQTMSVFASRLRRRVMPRAGGRVGCQPSTIWNYLVILKKMFSWGFEQSLVSKVPNIPQIKVPKRRPQPIPEEHFAKLLDAADPLMKAYLLCGWWAGLRLNEARELRRAANLHFPYLDLAGNQIIFPAMFAKSVEDQWVPLHPVLRAALEALPVVEDRVFPFMSKYQGRRLSRNALSYRVVKLAEKAGVPLTMHKLRKGFGCRVAKRLGKGNAPILHRLMRHKTMQITMDYYASVDDVLQDTIKEL
jgi:integrase